jgi:hypothetical protein
MELTMGTLLDKISKESIVKIAESHVRRFSNMLHVAAQGNTNIRVSECEGYKRTWERVVESNGENLTKAAKGELLDALFSGSYNDMLTEEERELLEGDEEDEYDEEDEED